MNFNKQGIMLACDQCEHVRSDGHGGLEIVVPIRISATGVDALARIHCAITAECHRVTLLELQGMNHEPIDVSTDQQRLISEALGLIAKQRLCGNSKLCPLQVVHVVDGHG